MGVVVAEAIWIGVLVLAAVLLARGWSVLRAALVALIAGAVAPLVLATAGLDVATTPWPFHVVNLVLALVALGTGQVLGGTRQMARALEASQPLAGPLLPEVAAVLADAQTAGYRIANGSPITLDDHHLVVLVHPDGSRAELIQAPGRPPGYSVVTQFAHGEPLVSMPWRQGIDRTRHRVPGASFLELVEHHRAAVASRTAAGALVVPADAATALEEALESDRAEAILTLERPWRNAMLVALQQLPVLRHAVPG